MLSSGTEENINLGFFSVHFVFRTENAVREGVEKLVSFYLENHGQWVK